jgi:hypothetical protein
MQNLAGNKDCDKYIKDELERAGIDVIPVDGSDNEVPATLGGRLGPFTFTRAWHYWVVSGPMPLDVAKELYAHPEGARTVRVAGHCGCPAPEDPWVQWHASDGAHLWPKEKYEKELAGIKDSHLSKTIKGMIDSGEYRVSEHLEKDGEPYVMSYHIDDQAGLLLFATKVREHKLHENAQLLSLMQRINELDAQGR